MPVACASAPLCRKKRQKEGKGKGEKKAGKWEKKKGGEKEKGENKKTDAMSANLRPLEPAKPKPAPIPARPGALMGVG